VSPATLFRYFATKEDIVLQDSYDPLIADAVRAGPAHESLVTAVRRGLADALADVYQGDIEAIRQRTALILSVPALRARSREQQDSLITHLTRALRERNGRGHTDFDIEVAASTCAAVLEVAVARWARDGGDLPTLVDAAFEALGRLTKGPHLWRSCNTPGSWRTKTSQTLHLVRYAAHSPPRSIYESRWAPFKQERH